MRTESLAKTDDNSADEQLRRRFLTAGATLQRIGAQAGYRIIPTLDPRLVLFSKLDVATRTRVVELLEVSCQIYAAVIAEHQSVTNSASVIWKAFKTLNLIPPGDFLDKITEGDVIQLYTQDGFHLFVNLRFFEVCSYTLEQVYSLPWVQLWNRDPQALTHLQNLIGRALGPDQRHTAVYSEPAHLVRETESPLGFELSYRVRGIGPIWERRPNRKVGFVIIERGEILNARSPEEEEQILTRLYNQHTAL